LHIAYNREIAPTTRQTTVDQKKNIEDKKKEIQFRLWNKLSIKVDKVVQRRRTSNTGNVARNTEKVAKITGINLNLLKRFSTILKIISRGYEINNEKFEKYTKETAKLYVELYNWYRMPPSIHKILIHGLLIIKLTLFQINSYQRKPKRRVIKTIFDLVSLYRGNRHVLALIQIILISY